MERITKKINRTTSIWGAKGAAANGEKKVLGRKLKPGEIRVQKDVSELDGVSRKNRYLRFAKQKK